MGQLAVCLLTDEQASVSAAAIGQLTDARICRVRDYSASLTATRITEK